MREIPLTQGKVALVDDADHGWLSQWKWHAQKQRHIWYAIRGDGAGMHRLLLGLTDPKIKTDHQDGNGLHNWRANLRPATHTENSRHRHRQTNNTSGFIGVNYHRAKGKWEARIRVNKARIHIGYFDSPEEAGMARDEKAKIYHGEFAGLN